jgi:hypothetical protein
LFLSPKENPMLRLLAACLAAAPLIAFGATIYKVQLEDGSILFTDSPPPGSKILQEREVQGTSRPAPPRSVAGTPTPPRAATGIPPGSTVTPLKGPSIEAATAEVAAAERELAVARRKLELGREPLPGERLGLKGGGTRLSPEYESRVGELEKEVAAAEARLKRAYEARNNAR